VRRSTRASRPHMEFVMGGSAGDLLIQTRNDINYRNRRGRICLTPGCKEQVRYSKDEQRCPSHEIGIPEVPDYVPPAPPKRWRGADVPGLKAARVRRSMSQKHLSVRTGINVNSIRLYEACHCGPRIENADKLATALGVSFEELRKKPPAKKSGEAT